MRFRQRSKRNHRTTRKVPKHTGTSYSLVPAIGIGGLVAMRVMEGTVNRRHFEGFLKHQLVSPSSLKCSRLMEDVLMTNSNILRSSHE